MRKQRKRARSNPRKVTARAYSGMLKRLAALRRSGKKNQWVTLADKMHRARKRMIAANSSGVSGKRTSARSRSMAQEIEKARRTKQGKKMLAQYRRFWGLKNPTSIIFLPGDGKKSVTYLMGTGNTPEVHLSSAPRGKKGQRVLIRGKWKSGMLPDGRMVILTRRPLQGKLKFVGWAPETHYVPTRAMEKAGTPKKYKHWRHKHHDNDGRWPRVFADRNGKVDSRSNFVYDKSTLRLAWDGKVSWLDR